uniref:Uncharacterized protein n=1 Tax=Siphoviridae sp. ctMeu2 TaxID=2826262 RepID=A0A8S5LZI4_9CAUD|nr:MAG TPA: hypothetical protein [Siphoviridae sp. ctMeu2]
MVWFFRSTNARLFLDDQGWPATKTVTLAEDSVVDVSIKTNRPAGGGGGNGNVMILGREEQVPAGTPPNTVIVRKV